MDEINTEINNLINADDKMNIQFNQDIRNWFESDVQQTMVPNWFDSFTNDEQVN